MRDAQSKEKEHKLLLERGWHIDKKKTNRIGEEKNVSEKM